MKTTTSDKISEIQSELDLSNEQLADLLEVSVRTVQRWDKENKDIKLGRTAGTKNLQYLIEVMDNEITKVELKKTLSKFQGMGKDASIPLISSVLDTMALITSSELMGPVYGKEIISMLKNVIAKTYNN